MKFEEALQAMRKGRKVRRESWTPGYHYRLDGAFLLTSDGYDAYIHAHDLLATDWQIVGDPPKPANCAECDRLRKELEESRLGNDMQGEEIRRLQVERDELRSRNNRQAETIRRLQDESSKAQAFETYYDQHLQQQYTAKPVDLALRNKECCKAVCQEEAKPFEMHLVGKVSWWPPVTVGQDDEVTVNIDVKPIPQA